MFHNYVNKNVFISQNILKVTQFVDNAGFPSYQRGSAYGNRGNVPIIVLDTDESVLGEVTNSFKQHSLSLIMLVLVNEIGLI
jgi:hypothetical protein